MTTGIVAIGYGDGYPRNISANTPVMIQGQRCQILGRVSMDMITLDVTDIPQAHAHPGAAVDLIGGPYPVDRFAADAGTIGYEILTMLGQRYRRLYVEDGKQRIAAE